MATSVTHSESGRLKASPDVVGAAVITVLGLLHLFGLQVGGAVGFVVLLVGWPLVGGTVAARLSPVGEERVAGVVAGALAAITTTLLVFVVGLFGAWSGFITGTFGVTLWPVTFAMLALLTIAWSVFGLAGAELSVRVRG
ncbi:hypothetical protein [Halobellus limi]|jgi:hypothetical protein|uniref:DUF5518 domain-containing protein n=1 Tax=Halobellus limi TaxID=699433 RepID=A0A1H5U749_9EURY|nr:hypothetical protein [Halobellus limi]QCC47140.1 hypothetical protein DV707_05340 [Halobellus limi]SEF70117.1 hypothetical protein SAMN04488133_0483 [Halobellus limi]